MTPIPRTPTSPSDSTHAPGRDVEHIAALLHRWQEHELALARRFRECAGLTREQVEDLYQDTALALLYRTIRSEEHLRRALRYGLKRRALRVHRDERSHRAILTRHVPGIQVLARAKASEEGPERVALSSEERSLIDEFILELTPDEQRILWLTAEGVPAKRISEALGLPSEQAQNIKLSFERKRENYLTLYSTGKLCGLRSRVIVRLVAHQETSTQLAERAITHLQSCPHCRAEHQITAQRLRRIFEQQAAALLPIPALAFHTSHGSLARITHLPRHPRLKVPVRPSQVHARLTMILASTGPGTRVAAPLATIAILTIGAVGASHLLTHPAAPRHHDPISPSATTATAPADQVIQLRATTTTTRTTRRGTGSPHLPFGPGHIVPTPPSPGRGQTLNQREPGGFAYLGVPTQPNPPPHLQTEKPKGGPFSP